MIFKYMTLGLGGLLIIMLISLLFVWILSAIWLFTEFRPFVRFCHGFMGWHEPANPHDLHFDGSSYHAKCRWCGEDITRDSQGNWFISW